jgi:magnesium transporter
VVTIRVFRGERIEVVEDLDLLPGLVADRDSLVWVDTENPTDADLERIETVFGLHELAVEDIREQGQRAKLERYPDHAFLVAYARAADGDLCEVDLVFGRDWLVTVREVNDHGETLDITDMGTRYDRTRDLDRGVGFLVYVVLDTIVDSYFDAVEEDEERLEAIEDVLFRVGPPPGGSLQQDLLDLRRKMLLLRRRVVPLRDVVLGLLRREVPWIEEPSMVYFDDVLDHLLRVLDQIDVQRELMGNVVDASLALSANRMNQVMKKMTSWGAILIVATLIAGIYGMNFAEMPELRWQFGYPLALGLMLLSTISLFVYFKRKDWL